jgi:hypothetical protein
MDCRKMPAASVETPIPPRLRSVIRENRFVCIAAGLHLHGGASSARPDRLRRHRFGIISLGRSCGSWINFPLAPNLPRRLPSR